MGKHQIEIYQGSDGAPVEVRLEKESLWLSQAQMADLLVRDADTVSLP